MKLCHACSTPWDEISQPGVRASCAKCGADLHVCVNCRHYDTRKPEQCAHDQGDRVIDKEKANFCEEFQFADRQKTGPAIDEAANKARDQWKKLFGK